MSLYGFGKKMIERTSNPRFVFFTGKVLTPEEFGYAALLMSFNNSKNLTDEWFRNESIGSMLGLAAAIRKYRFGADIFTTMLHVGIYLYHAKYVLRINDAVLKRVSNGLKAGINDILYPNGKSLEEDFKVFLRQYAFNISDILLSDILDSGDADSSGLIMKTWSSTYELIGAIAKTNSEDVDVVAGWLKEINSTDMISSGLWLRQNIDNTTFSAMRVMIGDGKIYYLDN
jgi:hypothetical protein